MVNYYRYPADKTVRLVDSPSDLQDPVRFGIGVAQVGNRMVVSDGSLWRGGVLHDRNTICLIGDSITLRNYPTPTSSLLYYGGDGYFARANCRLGWPFEVAGIFGVSGENSTQILARVDSQVTPLAPKYCLVLAGTNDVTDDAIPVETTILNLSAIYEKLNKAGIIPIKATIPPRNVASSGMSAGRKKKIFAINRWIRESSKSYENRVVDFFKAVANPATGEWIAAGEYGALSNSTSDGIHPTDYGADLMALEIVSRFTGIVSNNTVSGGSGASYDIMYDATNGADVNGNIIQNGGFLGTGGTLAGSATGSLATSWVVQNGVVPSGAGEGAGAVTLSKVARTGQFGEWQQITISGGDAGNTAGRLSMNVRDVVSQNGVALSADTWQPGDQVYAQCAFETDASGWGGASGTSDCLLAMELECWNAGTLLMTKWAQNAAASSNRSRMPSGIMRTPIATIPAGTTRIYLWLHFRGKGTVRFADAEVRKVISI